MKQKNPSKEWQNDDAKTITFIVSKDCQLACRYCYLTGKNETERMSFETAKKAVDYILSHRKFFYEDSVIWEFIGGEPFLEIELVDQISDYFKTQAFLTNHPWFNSYRFSISTNGLLYADRRVQEYIRKNQTHISVGISIDGTKEKHDIQRVYKKTGAGSYDDVVKNVPLWLEQFPNEGTKVTVSHDDLPFICQSVLHLFALGITNVNINTVYEDVWHDGDDTLFEQQLIALADEMIGKAWYANHYCSFFSEYIGKPQDPVFENQNWCGAGKMLAIDADGNFYPCVRFAKYSLCNREAIIIGNVHEGLDQNKLRPFMALNRCIQSPQECIDCEVASGCAWCQGANYDFAHTDTIFQRATYICKMHKARVRANEYFWNKLYQTTNAEDEKF